MKQINFFVLFFVGYAFAFLFFNIAPASAALPDECRPEGGTCRSGSCPSTYRVDSRFGCPQISQRCCMPPASCYDRGGTCRDWIPGGNTCGRGGIEMRPNTCGYPQICCRYPSCYNAGGQCSPLLPPPDVSCPLGTIPGDFDCQDPGSSGPLCCVRPGGGGAPPPPPRYTITGVVYQDTNRNGTRDGGEPGVIGVTISIFGRISGSRTTNNSNGDYPAFANLLAGNYTLAINMPPGYINTTATIRPTSVGPSKTVNFGIVPLYSISGNVFNDTNKNRYKDSTNGVPEANISGITMSATAPISWDSAAGTFSMNNLFAGTYTVRYTSAIPAGYFLIYPRNGPPPAFSATVGPGCSVDRTSGATCSGGNISNLNFAISNSIPWMQSYGLSMRIDNGFDDVIPASPLYPPYASVSDDLNGAVAQLISTGTLPSSNASKTGPEKVYVPGLTIGARYRIVISGTFYYNVNDGTLTDAQWDDWLQNNKNCFCRKINRIIIDNQSPNAIDYQTSYNPAHEYTFLWTATSSTLEMYIPDTYWPDNSGSYSYRMYTSF